MVLMKYRSAFLFSIVVIVVVTSSGILNQSSAFISVDSEKENSCMNTTCHDLSDYKKTFTVETKPYENCICHSATPDFSLTLEVLGPRKLEPGERTNFTLKIHGGPGVTYGFGVNATNGTLPRNIHKAPLESNTFIIEYIAPAENQSVDIIFSGLSADGDFLPLPKDTNSTGDSWNHRTITLEIIKENTADNGTAAGNPSNGSSNLEFLLIITMVSVPIIIMAFTGVIISRRRKEKNKD